MKNLVAGLHILMKYDPNGYTHAEHDCVYAGSSIKAGMLSLEDAKEMDRLYWHWETDDECWVYFT